MEETTCRLYKEDLKKLNDIRHEIGFRSNACALHAILQEKAQNVISVEAVMSLNVPVVIVGSPLSGKSHFVKNTLLSALSEYPTLVIDSIGEYGSLPNIGYDIFGLDFENFKGHIRFVPNAYAKMAENEIENIFAQLDMKSKVLSRWVIVVEEAQSYQNVASFVRFLYSSRHRVRKMIAITAKSNTFEGLVTLKVVR
jgi:hypothetical protein